jgi:hypothetical protein
MDAYVGQAAREVMAAVNPHQSPVGPGPARQGPARSTESSGGDPIFVNCSNPATQPRTRQMVDLFQPVTSTEPLAATVTDQPVMPIDGLNQDDELLAATTQSGYAPGTRLWADRRAGLIRGTPGAAIALGASAALVLVMAGMTMFTTSSPTESPVAGLTPGRLAAPVTPAISDEHLVTVPPLDAPAGFARQTPTKAYSPDPPPAPAHQQTLPTAHRAVPASPPPPPAPDPKPLSPPPSTPPSTPTAEDAGFRTSTPGSYRGNMESQTADTEPCNCGTMREIPNNGDRPSKADRQRELRAQRAGYRSTSTTQESGGSEEGPQDRQTARPGANAGPRPSPNRGR